jgi:hypothetical protein
MLLVSWPSPSALRLSLYNSSKCTRWHALAHPESDVFLRASASWVGESVTTGTAATAPEQSHSDTSYPSVGYWDADGNYVY